MFTAQQLPVEIDVRTKAIRMVAGILALLVLVLVCSPSSAFAEAPRKPKGTVKIDGIKGDLKVLAFEWGSNQRLKAGRFQTSGPRGRTKTFTVIIEGKKQAMAFRAASKGEKEYPLAILDVPVEDGSRRARLFEVTPQRVTSVGTNLLVQFGFMKYIGIGE